MWKNGLIPFELWTVALEVTYNIRKKLSFCTSKSIVISEASYKWYINESFNDVRRGGRHSLCGR